MFHKLKDKVHHLELYERCILCDELTKTRKDDHIDNRTGYVTGLGQLCDICADKGFDHFSTKFKYGKQNI